MFDAGVPRLPVTPSRDLDRILAMPTRRDAHALPGGAWHPALDGLTPDDVSRAFRKPGGTMTLKTLQARALVEAARSGGLVGRIPVGKGKTLVSLLLPEVLRAERALLLVPAALVGSLQREIRKYEPHFHLPLGRIARVMSHAELSLPASTRLLEQLRPDVIIIDEVDAFANRQSVRTDRLLKYGRANPGVRWAVMSGTVFQKSVKDAVYWFALALRERSPLPLQRSEVETWVEVLDPMHMGWQPAREPGALMRLCVPGENPRQAWNRRASDTVGIVTSNEERLGVSLNFHERPVVMPEGIKAALATMKRTWCRPDGKEFSTALDLARLERQIAAGFYYRWVEEPDGAWLEARNNWARAVRARLQGTRRAGMDSPLLVEQAAERAVIIADLERDTGGARMHPEDLQRLLSAHRALPHFDSPEWRAWRVHQSTPEPVTEPVTLDDYLWQDAAAWGHEHVGIIWYLHDHVGRSIAEIGGFPLYGPGDDGILDEDGSRTVVASIKAHGVGKNLQAFHEALVVELPSSGQAWQQLVARMHRDGQEHPQVDVWIYRHSEAARRAWFSAERKARFMADMNGDDQRILYATRTFDSDATDALGFTPGELDVIEGLASEDDLR